MKYQETDNDTIAAISTPGSGEGGIGIVRLSGKNSLSIADKIFAPGKNAGDKHARLKPSMFKTHTVHYGWIVDGKTRIDEALLTLMRSPKTYTREDIVEISGHGGPAVLRNILELCISNGARIAGPGEFTRRAFLNGRIDLAQAEAVCGLIRAKTDRSSGIAVEQIKGALSEKIKGLRAGLIKLAAGLEAELDYSGEGIEFVSRKNARQALNKILEDINTSLSASRKNRVYVEGVKIAITGRPNVGKSSLFNALLEKERAIVTAIPGTTRDVIAETFNLRGIPVTIMDTAGIMSGNLEQIEKISTAKSKEILGLADIVIFVVDFSRPLSRNDRDIARLISASAKKVILVLNKADLACSTAKKRKKLTTELVKFLAAKEHPARQPVIVECSALKNKGIAALETALYNKILEENNLLKSPDAAESSFVVNSRQERSLANAGESISQALDALSRSEPEEFVVLHLRAALDRLGEITGETTTEEILDAVFSNFCVGK